MLEKNDMHYSKVKVHITYAFIPEVINNCAMLTAEE